MPAATLHVWYTANGAEYVALDSPVYECTSMELHSIKLRHNRLLIIISSVFGDELLSDWWYLIFNHQNLEISLDRNFSADARIQLAWNISCFLSNILLS